MSHQFWLTQGIPSGLAKDSALHDQLCNISLGNGTPVFFSSALTG